MFEEIPTPCIAISGPVVRRNLDRLADYARQRNLKVRPHVKTHKSLAVARMQLDRGAAGLTVAKLGEAKVMAAACDDLFVAYPAVDPTRCAQLAELANSVSVRVGIDSAYAADALQAAAQRTGATLGILVDFDAGNHRTGVQSATEALALAQHISAQSHLRLDGIMFYPGHLNTSAENDAGLGKIEAKIDEILAAWRKSGLEAKVVSGGSTPTAYHTQLTRQVTEIRPGTYVYNDMNILHAGIATLADVAARIVCTVVSTAVPGQVVLDAGSKTLTNDRCGPAPDSGHGLIVEYPQAKITRLTEEHGQVDVTRCERAPKVGERVTVVPNHICPCVNLRDAFWWYEGGFEQGGKPVQMPVDARGKVV